MPSELQPLQETLKVTTLWSASLGEGDNGKYLKLYPLVIDDKLFAINAEGDIGAFQADNGKHLWDVSTSVPVSSGLAGDEEHLVFGTEDGDVIAVASEDGRELWKKRLSSEVVAVSRVDLGIVVARTNDSKLYGLDIDNGNVRWQVTHKIPVLILTGVSTPLIDLGKLVVGFDDGELAVYSLFRGQHLWETPVGIPKGKSELERMVDIDGVIKVADGIIYAVAFHGQVMAVTLVDGRVLWARGLSSYEGLDVDDQRVYVTDEDDNVWALDRRTGASLWKQDKFKYRKLSAPSVLQDYVLVSDFEGYVHWLAKSDGHLVARTQAVDGGTLVQPIVVGSRAYVQGREGDIVALELPEEEKTAP